MCRCQTHNHTWRDLTISELFWKRIGSGKWTPTKLRWISLEHGVLTEKTLCLNEKNAWSFLGTVSQPRWMWLWHKSPQAICPTAFPSFPQKPPWTPELQDQCLCSHSFFFCGMTGLRAPQWLHRSTKLIMLKFSTNHWVNANNANIFLGSNWDQRSENPQTSFGSQWFTNKNDETLKPPCLRWKSSVSLFNTFS
jgi:hypothetical protein